MDLSGDDPVVCVGGRTQWEVGGTPVDGVREVRAPSGIVEYEPAEMVVRAKAGTTVAELDAALAECGQMVPLDPADPMRATIGGVLAVGHSGLRRLRYGPVRDTLLEARYLSSDGRAVKAGGPVVKNVTGFDLCRLLVGSLGTLGFLEEVVLRAQPRPQVAQWLRNGEADPFGVRAALFRPSSILWDGRTTHVLLEGSAADVAAERAALPGRGWAEVDGPPTVPRHRRSLRPSALRELSGSFIAEVGVGTVHVDERPAAAEADPSTLALHRRIKETFDPAGRLNPGRSVLVS